LVLSFSHCVAKAALPPMGVPHVCYCFTPMRYAWHMQEAYLGGRRFGRFTRAAIRLLLGRLREWDRATADRVSQFVAISRCVQQRIADCYGRQSTVIYPPVDTDFYTPSGDPREDFYLCVGALAPYKRTDLAIQACNRLRRRLIVIGAGQDERRLRDLAGPTVELLGWQNDEAIRDHFRRCRALLFPGEEDFGIVPVEALACGTPVLAYGRGGAVESLANLGDFFNEQNVECLIEAILRHESGTTFDPDAARERALQFGADRYLQHMLAFLREVLSNSPSPLVGEGSGGEGAWFNCSRPSTPAP
jgi:glycosyltransferase involved in cell wall biosynthesis